jgi:IS5 family transposase
MSYLQDSLRIVDSTPVPVLKRYRGASSPCFPRGKQTNYGYCAAKKEYYYGVKLSLICTTTGVITDLGIHAANVHDLTALKSLMTETDLNHITLIGDKGYYDGELRTTLNNHNGRLVVPDKRRHHPFATPADTHLLRLRSIIETVNAQLKDHLRLEQTLARSYRGLVSRIWSIFLSFTFAQYFNLKMERPRLAVKSVLV